jgi:S-(hydroxymethyl)glutathione dehydrogenase/alcohol dehydrogenase
MEKQIRGSLFGSANPRADIPRLLDMYQCGTLRLDGLTTQHYKLEQINDGYNDLRQGRNLRGVIRF